MISLSSIWAPAKLAWDLYREKQRDKQRVQNECLTIKRSLKNELLSHRVDVHLLSLRNLFLQNPSLYDTRGMPEFYHKWIQPREGTLSVVAHVLTMDGATGADVGYWTPQLHSAMLADLETIKP